MELTIIALTLFAGMIACWLRLPGSTSEAEEQSTPVGVSMAQNA